MTIALSGRDRLYRKLREVLGTEEAGTLIGMLPPETDQIATKMDVDRLDQRMDSLDQRMDSLDQRMDSLDQRMERFEDRLWDFHGALRAQTRTFATIVVTAMLGIGSLSFAAAALL